MKTNNSQLKFSEKGVITESVKAFTAKFASDTLSSDVELFKKLGLKTFSRIPPHEEYYVGEVKLDYGSTVKVWVYPMPATFWKFEVYIAERKRTIVVSTGSGTLSNFWNTIKLIAEDMLDINYK